MSKKSKHPDAKLIDACIAYAAAHNGAWFAISVDPNDNAENAERIAPWPEGTKAARPAKTIAGLYAKAAALKAIKQVDAEELKNGASEMVESLVDDVISLLQVQALNQATTKADKAH